MRNCPSCTHHASLRRPIMATSSETSRYLQLQSDAASSDITCCLWLQVRQRKPSWRREGATRKCVLCTNDCCDKTQEHTSVRCLRTQPRDLPRQRGSQASSRSKSHAPQYARTRGVDGRERRRSHQKSLVRRGWISLRTKEIVQYDRIIPHTIGTVIPLWFAPHETTGFHLVPSPIPC